MGEIINSRPSWTRLDGKYAIWHDGGAGSAADWIFGYARDMGDSSPAIGYASDENPECPHLVADWTPLSGASPNNVIICSKLNVSFLKSLLIVF